MEPKQVITVIADVHAEMNANVPESRSAVSPTESQSNLTMAKMAETKRLLPTPEQKRLYDEIFAIEDNVDWKTVSNNLHQYRIETIEKSTAATVAGKPKETSVSCLYVEIGLFSIYNEYIDFLLFISFSSKYSDFYGQAIQNDCSVKFLTNDRITKIISQ